MKTSELKEIIRDVVKQEVITEVNKQMVKLVAQILKETRSSKPTHTQKIVESTLETVKPPVPVRKLTGNPMLDSILSDTIPFTKEQKGEYAKIMTETFSKIGGDQEALSEPKTKMDFLKSIVSDPVSQRTSVVDTAPPAIKKLFDKDFGAILKKSKAGSSGMFNPSMILSGERDLPSSIPQG
jgi:hypothetical protein